MKLAFVQTKWFLRLTYIICIPIIIAGIFVLGLGRLFSVIGWLMMFEPKQALKSIKLP